MEGVSYLYPEEDPLAQNDDRRVLLHQLLFNKRKVLLRKGNSTQRKNTNVEGDSFLQQPDPPRPTRPIFELIDNIQLLEQCKNQKSLQKELKQSLKDKKREIMSVAHQQFKEKVHQHMKNQAMSINQTTQEEMERWWERRIYNKVQETSNKDSLKEYLRYRQGTQQLAQRATSATKSKKVENQLQLIMEYSKDPYSFMLQKSKRLLDRLLDPNEADKVVTQTLIQTQRIPITRPQTGLAKRPVATPKQLAREQSTKSVSTLDKVMQRCENLRTQCKETMGEVDQRVELEKVRDMQSQRYFEQLEAALADCEEDPTMLRDVFELKKEEHLRAERDKRAIVKDFRLSQMAYNQIHNEKDRCALTQRQKLIRSRLNKIKGVNY
ncbi:hypothetical protein FGO68_gene17648 [Halteria grandinella]|uniref:Uncharacterized protein n=1 Tax=Halteria grandinella TaxID=5974 RepID=A0A8J8NPU0_HALGN|nr:hypothetical protein FGO68_gene17648 [Halteria grandinella]